MPLRIAFGSQARVGKDTACEYLQEKYGGQILHFSDPIYDILHYAQGVAGFEKIKDRSFLQWVGTEWGRTQNENVWVDATIKRIPPDENCYISDVRFPNELKTLQENGFTCIKIIRPNIDTLDHSSEVALRDSKDWNYVIVNDGGLQAFYKKIDRII